MNYDYIRNLSLILSVSLFATASGLMVFWLETPTAPASLIGNKHMLGNTVRPGEQLDWQFCDPFENTESDKPSDHVYQIPDHRVSGEVGSREIEQQLLETPALPAEAGEWVEIAKGG
ncbi:hypothetical protein [Acanthopleuribacter pedis]|uniref:Uncharacterized protein n=1 Tax=Acanthopleuribacter pedis TaxID=442870 RepID=A0A8J7U5K8_9BACT|nr:hypothetical protein [Acanthopleuribacter pedis]MBO1322668.1 hypothetical protein [Acanthopleuribacter pedis]